MAAEAEAVRDARAKVNFYYIWFFQFFKFYTSRHFLFCSRISTILPVLIQNLKFTISNLHIARSFFSLPSKALIGKPNDQRRAIKREEQNIKPDYKAGKSLFVDVILLYLVQA